MRYKNGVYIPPLDDVPVDGQTEEGITSNRVFDHEGNTTTAHGAVSAATANKHVVRDASARAKFAAAAAAGDALTKGTRVTTAELPAMTDEKIWKGTGGNVEEVDMPSGGATLTVADTEVFNDTPPTSWTDLDLSGTVGAQATLVMLKFIAKSSGYGFNRVAVRRNGDTDEFFHTVDVPLGVATAEGDYDYHIVLLVTTDTDGRIEWRVEHVSLYVLAIIDVMAYIK